MIIEVICMALLAGLSLFVSRRDDELVFVIDAISGDVQTTQDILEKLIVIADRYYREKRYLPAEKAYLRLLKYDHKNLVAYNRLGFIYTHFTNFDDAVECFKIVAEAHSTATAHQNLAMAYFKKQDYTSSADELKKASELEPTTARYLSLARIYRQLKRSDAQIDVLQKAVTADPDNVEILNLLADALMQNKDTVGARRVFSKIVRLDPKNQRARSLANSH